MYIIGFWEVVERKIVQLLLCVGVGDWGGAVSFCFVLGVLRGVGLFSREVEAAG